MPVAVPAPNAFSYCDQTCGPILLATWIVPMFDDSASTPVAVNCSSGWVQASWTTTPSSDSVDGTSTTLAGVPPPFSRAAAKVTTLFTDPGSNGVWMAGLLDALELSVDGSAE